MLKMASIVESEIVFLVPNTDASLHSANRRVIEEPIQHLVVAELLLSQKRKQVHCYAK